MHLALVHTGTMLHVVADRHLTALDRLALATKSSSEFGLGQASADDKKAFRGLALLGAHDVIAGHKLLFPRARSSLLSTRCPSSEPGSTVITFPQLCCRWRSSQRGYRPSRVRADAGRDAAWRAKIGNHRPIDLPRDDDAPRIPVSAADSSLRAGRSIEGSIT